MLHIGDKQLSLQDLRNLKHEPVNIDDCYCLYEYFNNTVDIKWEGEADEDIQKVEIRIYTGGEESGRIEGGSLIDGEGYTWKLPNNYVGLFQLDILINEECINAFVEVKPRKMDDETYSMLMNDLRERNISIYQKCSAARTSIGKPRLKPYSNLAEQFEALRKDMKQLCFAVERIAENPRKRLNRVYYRTPLSLAAGVDEKTVRDLCGAGARLRECDRERVPLPLRHVYVKGNTAYQPEAVLSSKVEIDYNVFENRLLKRFLKLIAINMKTIELLLEKQPDKTAMLDECKSFRRDAVRMSKLSFLEDVSELKMLSGSSIALRRDAQYMRFYDIFKRFISRPYYDRSSVYNIGIGEISRLYEFWCAAFILDTLLMLEHEGWGDIRQKYMKTDELGFMANPDSQVEMFSISREKESITMTFQHHLPPFVVGHGKKRPDITLKYENGEMERGVIIDPKYRADLFQGYDDNSERSAVDDMHIYRDAIRKGDGSRKFNWAMILYPGRSPSAPLGVLDKWADGENNSGIAAFCLRPQEKEADTSELKEGLLKTIKLFLVNN